MAFFNGNSQISGTPTYTYAAGSIAGTASLTATLSTSFTATASITAQYSGDVNYGNSHIVGHHGNYHGHTRL